MRIAPARSAFEIAIARALFQEYADALGIDLCFQGFTDELRDLPGAYAPPRGELLLGWDGDDAAGCVALRPLPAPRGGDDVCEMKRLYVRPAQRKTGLGRALAEAIIAAARDRGYARMRLDTLATMTPAMTLYRALGFVEIPAYYGNPLEDVRYFELRLERAG